MFAIVAAMASCARGFSTCDDQGVLRRIAIFSFVAGVLVVSAAWLIRWGSREYGSGRGEMFPTTALV